MVQKPSTEKSIVRQIAAFALVGLLVSTLVVAAVGPGVAAQDQMEDTGEISVEQGVNADQVDEAQGEIASILINELACSDEEDFENRLACQLAAESIGAKYGFTTSVIVKSAISGSWAGPGGAAAGIVMGA